MKAWIGTFNNEFVTIVLAETKGKARQEMVRQRDMDRADFVSFPVRRFPSLDGEAHIVTDSEYYAAGFYVYCCCRGCMEVVYPGEGHVTESGVCCPTCYRKRSIDA